MRLCRSQKVVHARIGFTRSHLVQIQTTPTSQPATRQRIGHFQAIWGAPGTKVDNLTLAARSRNLLPEEVLHVGDGDNDRKAAREFGCPFIGVCDSADGPDGAWKGASFAVVPDMHQACTKICAMVGVKGMEPSAS